MTNVIKFNKEVQVEETPKAIKELFTLEKDAEGNPVISGRELHEALGIETQYTKWIDRMISYGFEENTDYKVISKKSLTNNPKNPYTIRTDHMMKVDMALAICSRQEKYGTQGKIYKYLLSNSGSNNEVVHLKEIRKEYKFGEMLKKLTDTEWIEQYPIDGGKYYLDFYTKEGLIVEYDEVYHEYQTDTDVERIEYCLDWIAEENLIEDGDSFSPAVIRVKEGFEMEGLKRIIDYLISADITDVYQKDCEADIKARQETLKKLDNVIDIPDFGFEG